MEINVKYGRKFFNFLNSVKIQELNLESFILGQFYKHVGALENLKFQKNYSIT